MKTVKNIFVLTSTMAALLASGNVAAETASSDFYVTIKIKPVCTVATNTGNKPTETQSSPAGADIDFGEYVSNHSGDIDKESQGNTASAIQVQCTKGTPYKIALAPETENNTAGGGKMNSVTSGNSDQISYNLYKDISRNQAWGDQDSNMLTGSGKGFGQTETHVVYGRVPNGQLDKAAGRYADKVNVTVQY